MEENNLLLKYFNNFLLFSSVQVQWKTGRVIWNGMLFVEIEFFSVYWLKLDHYYAYH